MVLGATAVPSITLPLEREVWCRNNKAETLNAVAPVRSWGKLVEVPHPRDINRRWCNHPPRGHCREPYIHVASDRRLCRVVQRSTMPVHLHQKICQVCDCLVKVDGEMLRHIGARSRDTEAWAQRRVADAH